MGRTPQSQGRGASGVPQVLPQLFRTNSTSSSEPTASEGVPSGGLVGSRSVYTSGIGQQQGMCLSPEIIQIEKAGRVLSSHFTEPHVSLYAGGLLQRYVNHSTAARGGEWRMGQ